MNSYYAKYFAVYALLSKIGIKDNLIDDPKGLENDLDELIEQKEKIYNDTYNQKIGSVCYASNLSDGLIKTLSCKKVVFVEIISKEHSFIRLERKAQPLSPTLKEFIYTRSLIVIPALPGFLSINSASASRTFLGASIMYLSQSLLSTE